MAAPILDRPTAAGGASRTPPTARTRPRRPPRQPRPPLGARDAAVQGVLAMVVVAISTLLAHLVIFSHVQHLVSQDQLRQQFTEQLSAGTAPVSEGTFEDVLLTDGSPVARLEIPAIGVDLIVVEGTDPNSLMLGLGHRRDTSLPGQNGVSVIMGRASAFGAPFQRIHELKPGETFSVFTGQGEHIYQVMGVRYAGEPRPLPPAPNQGSLVLETARGVPYVPTGITRVDATLISEVFPKGMRDTTYRSLPATHRELASDPSTLWALVFCLQLLLAAEVAAVWTYRRLGLAKTWIVFCPVILLIAGLTSDQVLKLLPNLM